MVLFQKATILFLKIINFTCQDMLTLLLFPKFRFQLGDTSFQIKYTLWEGIIRK